MPSWNEILLEIQQSGYSPDVVRRKYLADLQKYRKRNIICYYSGWLQQTQTRIPISVGIDNSDIHAFMCVLKNLDKKMGLDLILHTPGGSIAPTEKIINYLKSYFSNDIETFVPQLAQSAGTMIACASKCIYMGKHSSLGAIDPQIGGIPAYSIRKSFKTALEDIEKNQNLSGIWSILMQKYHPSLVVGADKAIEFTKKLVKDWLKEGLLFEDEDKENKAEKIVEELSTKMAEESFHDRHIGIEEARKKGLKISELEKDRKLQDLVLSVHHSYILTLSSSKTPILKIVENQKGIAKILTLSKK